MFPKITVALILEKVSEEMEQVSVGTEEIVVQIRVKLQQAMMANTVQLHVFYVI